MSDLIAESKRLVARGAARVRADHPYITRSVRQGRPTTEWASAYRRECARSPRTPVSLSVTAGGVRSRRAAAPTFRAPSRRLPEPRLLDEPGLVPVPPIARGLRAPGRPRARPRASAASRHPGRSSRSPCAMTRDQLHRQGWRARAVCRRTRMPAPRQSGTTLSAAN